MAQTTYEQISDRPLPFGAIADGGPRDIVTIANSSPGAVQVDLMTITNYVNAKKLEWTFDGVAFSYTMTAADTNVTGVAASIVTQLQAEPIFGGRFYATSVAGVITLTGRSFSQGWTLLATGTWAADNAITNSVALAAGSALPFGRLTVQDGQITGAIDMKGKLASAANLTARAVKLTPTIGTDTGTLFQVSVTVAGVTYLGSYTGDGSATVKEVVEGLVADLNAKLPAQTVVATEDDTSMTLTSELAGLDFVYGFGANQAANTWAVTSDNSTASCDINQAAIGIAVETDSVEIQSATVPAYGANRACSVMKKGRIVVQTPTLVVPTRGVWVRLANGTATSPIGSFRDTAATDCVQLDSRRFRWMTGKSAYRAILQVNCD
jgi:hypothetical protein